MPTYAYECPSGHQFERYLSLKDYAKRQRCECGKYGKKVILSAPLGFVQGECMYDCPVTGAPITSRAQHRENLKRHGCQQYDPEMKKDAERFRREKQESLERSVDETVERTIDAMPGRKKELLERELTAGADVEITRKSV